MTATSRNRRWMVILGIVVLVVGILGAVALWFTAGQRLDDAISGLARAPVGCDTVLDFDRDGEFLLFIETTGTVDEVRGDCDSSGDFEWEGDGDLPVAVLSMVDADGNDVTLSRDSGVSYSGAGASGELVRSVSIDEPGDHTLRVESDDSDFLVAVGTDPNDGVAALRWAAIAALIASLIAGVLLIVFGSRGRAAVADDLAGLGPTPSNWPTSPPGFPAPPPTTGATGAVGPPVGPPVRPPTGALPPPPPSAR